MTLTIFQLQTKTIHTQLSKSGQDKMSSSLKHYMDILKLKDYIHCTSSYSILVSAMDDLKSEDRTIGELIPLKKPKIYVERKR